MKILRLAAILLALLTVLLAATAVTLFENRDRLVDLVLHQVYQRTGLRITIKSSHISLSTHLIVELDSPRAVGGARLLVNLKRLRAEISYHSLLFRGGTPLYALILENPDITVPMQVGEIPSVPLPVAGKEVVKGILFPLQDLGKVAWRIETIDATIRDSSGVPVVNDLGMVAFHKHVDSAVWMVAFDARVVRAPMAGLRIAGQLRGGVGKSIPANQVASGHLWYWNGDLARTSKGAALQAEGKTSGDVRFALDTDGVASGSGEIGVAGLKLGGPQLTTPDVLGDYTLGLNFNVSTDSIVMRSFTLQHAGVPLAIGDSEILNPFSPDPDVTFHVTGIAIDAATLRKHIRHIRGVPAGVLAALDRVGSGNFKISDADLTTDLDTFREQPVVAVRDGLEVSANLTGASFPLPSDFMLPPVSGLGLALQYADGILQFRQGTATVGRSALRDISVRLNVENGLDQIPYELSLKADADLTELFPAIRSTMKRYQVAAGERISSVGGRIGLALSATSMLAPGDPQLPAGYRIHVEPDHAVVKVKGTPGPVEFRRGSMTIDPGSVRIDQLALAATGGDGLVNGKLAFDSIGVHVRDATVELHQMPAGLWLALVVDPADLRIDGPLGGKVEIRGDPSHANGFVTSGRLVMNEGDIRFGFLRAPIVAQGATVKFDRHSMQVAIPSSTLEGQGLSMLIRVADLENPVVRVDADSQNLDLEVMKFIRMPWSPSTPPAHFPYPAHGFIHARKAHIGVFPMSAVSGDFSYSKGDWRVWNFAAKSFQGNISLDVSGRQKDDWIHMKGKVANIDLAPLFLLSKTRNRSPVLGRAWLAVDMWADTNSDFFQTMSGSAAITMRDGTIDRMTLLSRMLALIDLKSWLTGEFPDPTISGLPFKTIFADLKGKGGVLWTQNFLLQGPVMDITAEGNVDVGQGLVDMRVAMFPFSTVHWLVSKIPIIGENVAGGTGGILAAYMHVHGPAGDPSITPMPITSVTEFVKRTLGMPINIIRPNTIK